MTMEIPGIWLLGGAPEWWQYFGFLYPFGQGVIALITSRVMID